MPSLPKSNRPYWHKPKSREETHWDNPWYNTRRWQVASKMCRYLDYPICKSPKLCVNWAHCGNLAEVADHIKPVKSGRTDAEREQLMWDASNHQPICKPCHERKSAKEKA